MNPCQSCGSDVGGANPHALHCGNCPPTRCEDCGEMCDWGTGSLCSCWIDLTTMPLADVKALFAAHDDELSIDPTIGGQQ